MNRINLSELEDVLCTKFDLFICSSSFEERCTAVSQSVNKSITEKSFVIFNADDTEYLHIIEENRDKITKLLGPNAHGISISLFNPLLTADNLDIALNSLLESSTVATILFDITTFTHEAFLILFRLIKIRCPSAKVTYVYANAAEYSLNDNVPDKWLSSGIGEIRTVLGYPGLISPSRKTHMILIVGYEHERATAMIETVEPDSIAIGYGRSNNATTDKDKDANEHYKILVERMAASYAEITSFEIPCNDPYKACQEIQIQIDSVNDMNVLLIPMNNKLSTLGAALAAHKNEQVQICYAPALRYNYENYSSPGSECYIFEE